VRGQVDRLDQAAAPDRQRAALVGHQQQALAVAGAVHPAALALDGLIGDVRGRVRREPRLAAAASRRETTP